MKASLIALSLLYLHPAFAFSPDTLHVEHEVDDGVETFWTKRDQVHELTILPVRIGLAQRNFDYGHDLLMRLADPHSKEYGKHLSAAEVTKLFAPAEKSVAAVRDWVKSAGIPDELISISDNKQWLQFDAPAFFLEGLLRTKYHSYRAEDGTEAIGCERYHVPKNIQEHIDFVKPGLLGTFPFAHAGKEQHDLPGVENDALGKRDEAPKPKPCSYAATPECIRELYNVTDTISRVPGNGVGLYQSGPPYNASALKTFLKLYAPDVPPNTRPLNRFVDSTPKTAPLRNIKADAESDLDQQVILPLVYPEKVINFQRPDKWEYYNASRPGLFNPFLDAIDGSYCNFTAFGITGNTPRIDGVYPNKHPGGYKGNLQCGVYKVPNVISISYGNLEKYLPARYLRRQCLEFMKLSLQGTSIFAGSGDNGVTTQHAGRRCSKENNKFFLTDQPSGCPYITVVGGTRIPQNTPARPGVEVASQGNEPGGIYSGGGFSNVFPRPSYQDAAVKEYFAKYEPPFAYYRTKHTRSRPKGKTGFYNRAGRGYPDVAALAQNIRLVRSKGPIHTGLGTSVACPIWAGLITRINNHRIRAGKSTVGFLNPVLYKNPQLFNDITKGKNPGCYGHGPSQSFKAVPGWDPVTGLGSPNYGIMLEYFMSLM